MASDLKYNVTSFKFMTSSICWPSLVTISAAVGAPTAWQADTKTETLHKALALYAVEHAYNDHIGTREFDRCIPVTALTVLQKKVHLNDKHSIDLCRQWINHDHFNGATSRSGSSMALFFGGGRGRILFRWMKIVGRAPALSLDLSTWLNSLNSTKAYLYVRRKFALPYPATIHKWFSSIDGTPDFAQEAFNVLKSENWRRDWERSSGLCGHHASQHEAEEPHWCLWQICFWLTEAETVHSSPPATDVLIFMTVALSGSWKIPLGYFFIARMSGEVHNTKCLGKCSVCMLYLCKCSLQQLSSLKPLHFTGTSKVGAYWS